MRPSCAAAILATLPALAGSLPAQNLREVYDVRDLLAHKRGTDNPWHRGEKQPLTALANLLQRQAQLHSGVVIAIRGEDQGYLVVDQPVQGPIAVFPWLGKVLALQRRTIVWQTRLAISVVSVPAAVATTSGLADQAMRTLPTGDDATLMRQLLSDRTARLWNLPEVATGNLTLFQCARKAGDPGAPSIAGRCLPLPEDQSGIDLQLLLPQATAPVDLALRGSPGQTLLSCVVQDGRAWVIQVRCLGRPSAGRSAGR